MEIKNFSRRRKAQLILASHYYRSVKEDARCRREILMLDPGRPGPKCVAKRIRDDLTDRGAGRIKPKGATITAAPIFDFDQTESCLLCWNSGTKPGSLIIDRIVQLCSSLRRKREWSSWLAMIFDNIFKIVRFIISCFSRLSQKNIIKLVWTKFIQCIGISLSFSSFFYIIFFLRKIDWRYFSIFHITYLCMNRHFSFPLFISH